MVRQAQRKLRHTDAPDAPGPYPDVVRPKVRGDCAPGVRPCPFVSCRYNLFLDAKRTGAILFNFGTDAEALWDMPETCALDVAARGGMSLEDVAPLINVTRERVRQIEGMAMQKLQRVCVNTHDADSQGRVLPKK